MFKYLVVILLTLFAPFSAFAQSGRMLNEVSIVALIITSGGETPVSDSVTRTLESLDAQTLTANGPNASEMRSTLKRFTAAAIDTDVALVYYDGAVLKLGDRDFVVPGGIELNRPTDLLTKAIPLSALARATALAGNGGAVLVHSSGQNIDLIDGVALSDTAPDPRTGTSPVLFASSSAARTLAEGLEAMAESDQDIDLSEALAGLAQLEGVTISQMPARPAMLRKTPAPVVETVAAVPETTTETTAAPAGSDAEQPEASGGISLPQVGNEPTAPEETAQADAVTTEATTDIVTEPVATTLETTEIMAPADGANAPTSDTAAVAAPNEDPGLSIDVLRAMQGALARSDKRVLQRNLRNLGFYRGLIDGIFGRQTERAISSYQESIGATVTGVLTPSQLQDLSE